MKMISWGKITYDSRIFRDIWFLKFNFANFNRFERKSRIKYTLKIVNFSHFFNSIENKRNVLVDSFINSEKSISPEYAETLIPFSVIE